MLAAARLQALHKAPAARLQALRRVVNVRLAALYLSAVSALCQFALRNCVLCACMSCACLYVAQGTRTTLQVLRYRETPV